MREPLENDASSGDSRNYYSTPHRCRAAHGLSRQSRTSTRPFDASLRATITPMQAFPGPEHQPFETGDGPATAVLVHGFPGTPAEVRPMAAALAATGWRVRAPLLPGFGHDWGTLGERRWTEWRQVVAGEATRAASNGDPVLLLGFSMGAALALTAIADERAPADALVLVAPFTGFSDPRAALLPLVKRAVRTFRPYERTDFDDPHARVEIEAKVGSVDLDDPGVRERLRTEVRIPTAAVDELRQAGNRARRIAPSLAPRPTLVVQGERDTTVTPASTVALVRRLAYPPLRLFLPEADHRLVFPDQPGHMELLRALQRFGHGLLGRLDAS